MDTMLSIITLYNYDSTLFDNMQAPEEIDKQTLINNLLLELGEFELLYNDLDMLKFAIEQWSKKEINKWTKLYETTALDYNPIENYNRTEDFTDTETSNMKGDADTTDTIEKRTAGYNSDTMAKSALDTDTVHAETNQTGERENKRSGTIKGNIGVTTTQQMINQERDVLEFTIYNYIINSFKSRFCILVY